MEQRSGAELKEKFFLAAKRGKVSILREMMGRGGIDPMTRDEKGWTALHHAAHNGHIDAIKLFVNNDRMLVKEDEDRRRAVDVADGRARAILISLMRAKGLLKR